MFEDVALEDFYKHFKNHNQTRTQRTILKNDRMDNLHDQIIDRAERLNECISDSDDPKECMLKTQAFVNMMRGLMMVNQTMNLPRYQPLNAPRISINKQRK